MSLPSLSRVLLWGDDDDPPLARVARELARRGVETVLIDSTMDIDYALELGPRPTGALTVAGREIPLATLCGIYVRPTTPTSPARRAAGAALSAIASGVTIPVVNRPTAGRSNGSKPFQLRLLAQAGFQVPETLVTTCPTTATAFATRHGRVVYKSISGVRSIVGVLEPGAHSRLDLVRNSPVQFQRWIPGTDVRVHIVGERWFATTVKSEAIDYRYPSGGGDVVLAPTEIPNDLGQRLVTFARSLGLLVAGADLRLSPTGEWFAFEVNPSPGFSFYEDATGQPIAAAIADLLAPATVCS